MLNGEVMISDLEKSTTSKEWPPKMVKSEKNYSLYEIMYTKEGHDDFIESYSKIIDEELKHEHKEKEKEKEICRELAIQTNESKDNKGN